MILEGIKVLDLSRILAGPLCTQYLGDLGAEVIKVEHPDSGDDTRAWPPFIGEEGTVFLSANRNKRSIAVDLKSEEGKEIIRKLVKQSHVVVESFATGVTNRLGVDYETLKEINPQIIYCSISGYGRTGPNSLLPGYDNALQAYGGIMSLTGAKGGPPIRAGFSPIDQTTGIHAVTGILAALLHYNQTGEGQYLEVSLLETAVGFLGYQAQNYWATQKVPERMGTGYGTLCPYQVFESADGHILIAVGNDTIWRRFCPAVGLEDFMDDSRFKTNPDRVRNFNETVEIVQEVIKTRSTQEWLEVLKQAKVPCAPVNTIDQVVEDPQVKYREMILQYTHPKLGDLKGIAYPVSFQNVKREVKKHPPLIGEHTEEILQEIGYTSSQINDMTNEGIVYLNNESQKLS
ncbi:CaiB/BaiF CoA-transferase family protein [Bacillus sp. OK048]|uniref:CaiB/BaiF CoA transferase family protein n=1 Tax=Bacillus sp. OK048 TaxID=1882761 RepID=UPI0008884BA6|nr:CoA transferase [Bacillus sp. OK048]SDN97047.1 formyl-CoA transferase [Bacillus sp. OK048]